MGYPKDVTRGDGRRNNDRGELDGFGDGGWFGMGRVTKDDDSYEG